MTGLPLVRRARADKRLSVKQLADAAGVSESFIRRLESGKTGNPRDELLGRVAAELDLKSSEILEDRLATRETPA